MKKLLLFIIATIFAVTSFGQLTGTKTVGTGGDYATLALAIADLNAVGVGAGGVTFNVAAGHAETFVTSTSGLITATGTIANPIVFQKNGTGINPAVTAGIGVGAVDGIIVIKGGDYFTFDGIDLLESAGNTTTTTTMEWGYALVKASATDGSQNNVIKNCTVTLNKTNTYSACIYAGNHTDANMTALTVTNVSGANSYNKFYGNTLSNSYKVISINGFNDVTAPYAFYDQNNEIGVTSGNTISNFGGSSFSTQAIYAIYQNNIKVANNTITGGTGTTSTLYAIYTEAGLNSNGEVYNNTISLSPTGTTSNVCCIGNNLGGSGTTNTVSIYNNTIENINWSTATTGVFYGIRNYVASGANPLNLNIYNNIIRNNTISGTGNIGLIYNGASAGTNNANIYSNSIYGNQKAGASGTMYCIYATTASVSVHDNNIYNNTIPTTTGTSAATIYGYYNYGSPLSEFIYSNNIYGLTIGGTTASTASAVYGIYTYTASAAIKNIYANQVYNLAVNTTGGGIIYGIYHWLATPAKIYKNKLYNFSASAAGGFAYGIYVNGGATTYIYNNFISDLKTPAATGANAIGGIYINGGTTVGTYYNTVFLNATSTSTTTFGTSGIYKSSTTTGDFRNNVIVNLSTPGATGGLTAAHRWSAVYNPTYYASTSNNNCYFTGTPAANRLIFADGTNALQTIGDYKTFITGREGLAFTENPPFVNAVTPPFDLKMQTTVATQCESGGIRITDPIAIPTDYDDDLRWGETGYTGGGNAPDAGADEFTGIPLDLNPPSINYTALTNTFSTSSRTLVATVTDPSGVPTTAPGWPMLYWKINAGAYVGVAPSSVTGSAYTFDFGAGVILGDVVSYYIVAQDLAPIPNVGAFPAAGAAGFTNNPPAAATPPTSPSVYTIASAPLAGDYLVGTGGTYTTVTAAVADLNLRGVGAPVRFLLTDATYPAETFPININIQNIALPSASNTIIFKPNTGVTSNVSGASASSRIFQIQNSFVSFDGSNTAGGTTRDLTISNMATTAPVVIFVSSSGTTPITNVSVKNCILINGARTSSALVVTDITGIAGYFNNITVQNNSIQLAYIGIYFYTAVVSGNGSGSIITGNDLNATGANALRTVGIYVQGADGMTVSNNNIGNITTSTENNYGIWFATGTRNSTISGNTLSGISCTGTSGYAPRGIYVSSGLASSTVNVTGNTLTNISTSGSSALYGIAIAGATGGVSIQKNKVSNLKNTNTGGYSATGIALVSSLSAADISVVNNFIWDIAGYGYASFTTDNGYGIWIWTGGGYNVYFNSVRLSTDQTATTGVPACLMISSVSNANSLDIRNNIFYIDATVGTNRYAVICNAANTVFSFIDNNDYYSTGPNLGYFGAANVLDLAAWKTATGKDVSSISADPMFVGLNDLHIRTDIVSPVNNAGFYLANVTTDIDGNIRLNPPDIGACEFAPVFIYTWIGADNEAWTTPTNWNPTRSTPATNDVLQFNDGTSKTVTAVPTETIGKLILSNNTTINLQSIAASTLTISGGTGADLDIPAGSALNLNAINAINISIGTGATGSISGNIAFSATASTAHRLLAADPGAITFGSGSTFTSGTFFSGNPFGSTSFGSVIFASGSTYIFLTGSNPFGASSPNSVVLFQTGSLFKSIGSGTPSFSGRTYANFELDAPGQVITNTGGSAVTMDNLTITNGTHNFNMTGTPGHSIKGNISVAPGGTLNFAPASAGTVKLSGTAAQAISGTGTITSTANSTLEIANSAGVNLNTPLTLNGNLKLTAGLLTIGANNLNLGTASTISGTPSASAMIVATGSGMLNKSFTGTGSFTFPVGDNTGTADYSPVSVTINSGTFESGAYFGVNLINEKYPYDPSAVNYLDRYWETTRWGITGINYDATFKYVHGDVHGNESLVYCAQVLPEPFTFFNPADTTAHLLTANGCIWDGTFTGTDLPPFITISSPNGGEDWLLGSTHNITWDDNIPENVKIDLYKGGEFLQEVIASTPSTGTFTWSIPASLSLAGDYKIKITSTTDNTLFDFSDGYFTISFTPILVVQGITVSSDQSKCFNASQTIYVAGNGTTFEVQSGGSATMIAGQNIFYYPGTKVFEGGYMHGYIAPSGPFCDGLAPSIPMIAAGEDEVPFISIQSSFKIYPNPTTGIFTLELLGDKEYRKVNVEIYGMRGERVLTSDLTGEKKHQFSLSHVKTGLYFIRIIADDQIVTTKLIKQ